MNPFAQEQIGDMEKWLKPSDSNRRFAEGAVQLVLEQIDGSLRTFQDPCPAASSADWKTSCRTGILWLAYELTGDSKYRKTAEIQLESLKERVLNRTSADTHDLGVLYTLSCVAPYKLTGHKEAKRIAAAAADLLMERYFEKAGAGDALGSLKDPAERGRMIIDCVMNLPLLYWAARVTGNPVYDWTAARNAEQCAAFLGRKGASPYDTFCMDDEGRALSIYGFSLSYRYTDNPELLQLARDLAINFLNRFPAGRVDREMESPAIPVAICGMLELSGHLHAAGRAGALFEKASLHMLKSLAQQYTGKRDSRSNGIVQGIDERGVWGGYYYFEGLVRVLKNWSPYW
jgi:unsaturated chondroitin disaccharide hydrolase